MKVPGLFIELSSVFQVEEYFNSKDLDVRSYFNWTKFDNMIKYASDKTVICLTFLNELNYSDNDVSIAISRVSDLLLSSTGGTQMFYAFRLNGDKKLFLDQYKVLTDVISTACYNNIMIDLSNSVIFVDDIYYFKTAKLLNINSIFTNEKDYRLFKTNMGFSAINGISRDIQCEYGYSSPSLRR